MHCAAHSLGYVVLGLTFVSIFLPSSLALGLFLDALKVAAKLLFKTIEASGSTRGSDWIGWTTPAVKTGRRVCRAWSWLTTAIVVDALGVDCDVSEREVEPRGTWLLQKDPQVLQITTLKPLVELKGKRQISVINFFQIFSHPLLSLMDGIVGQLTSSTPMMCQFYASFS